MTLVFHKFLKFIVFLLIGLVEVTAQFKVPAKPAVLYPVCDFTNTLTATEQKSLNDKLIRYNDSTSVQIQVVILPTTNGEDVNHAAWMIGEKWGIRNKDQNNGIVFLIAKEDRQLSIQQGRDAEGALTASVAGQIIDFIITPQFKSGHFYKGIDAGTTSIMEVMAGKFKAIAKPKQEKKSSSGMPLWVKILILIVIFNIIRSFFGGGRNKNDDDDMTLSGRGKRRYRGGFFPIPFPFPGGGFGGGGSFGGGGGGGFGGFGGGGSGGFGGGGASGSW